MRHQKKGYKLGRNHHQRQALFKSLLKAIFKHGQIKTTYAKAKAVRPLIEKVANKAQRANLADRRFIFRYVQDRVMVGQIVKSAQATFGKQTSNFTKIVKLTRRQGDDALIVRLSFVKDLVKAEPKPASEKTKKETKPKKPVKKTTKKVKSKK